MSKSLSYGGVQLDVTLYPAGVYACFNPEDLEEAFEGHLMTETGIWLDVDPYDKSHDLMSFFEEDPSQTHLKHTVEFAAFPANFDEAQRVYRLKYPLYQVIIDGYFGFNRMPGMAGPMAVLAGQEGEWTTFNERFGDILAYAKPLLLEQQKKEPGGLSYSVMLPSWWEVEYEFAVSKEDDDNQDWQLIGMVLDDIHPWLIDSPTEYFARRHIDAAPF